MEWASYSGLGARPRGPCRLHLDLERPRPCIHMSPMFDEVSSCSKEYDYPNWEPAYEAAFLESDPRKLLEVIRAAEEQIVKRLQSIPGVEEYALEHKAILDACQFLGLLRIESISRI